VRTLRQAAVRAGGSLVLERGPLALKALLDVWGDAGPAVAVMRRLKETFDARGTLNPGRFVGGI
jgi:glycolate oxidase FAD binding subunit